MRSEGNTTESSKRISVVKSMNKESRAPVPLAKPRLLDLFCGAGGAAKGYQRAGFYVVGVDIKPQPHYCGDEFHQGDALTYPLEGFDAYHASPPCQGYSIMLNLPWLRDKKYPMLIQPVRELLLAVGKPYIIENVGGARYRTSRQDGLKAAFLCGQMFGLPIFRHRYFETNWFWMQPGHPKHEGSVRDARTLGFGKAVRSMVLIELVMQSVMVTQAV
jgi:SAM-dependent methyltransferase